MRSYLLTSLAILLAIFWGLTLQKGRVTYDMADAPASSYDESETVRLVSEIYRTMIRIGHVEDDEVVWPPHPHGHTLDMSMLSADCRIDARVVSLMQRLPVTTFGLSKALYPGMRPVDYRDPEDLADSRDIDKLSGLQPEPDGPEVLDMNNALPTELLLLAGEESDDACLVLDVADNTIRLFDQDMPGRLRDLFPSKGEELEFALDHSESYRVWPALPARESLERMLAEYRDALFIPGNGDVLWSIESSDEQPWLSEMRRRLIEDYGWPDNFRQDDWQRDRLDIETQLLD